jgi:geranylgeranyl diphosphate synthase type II
MRYAVFSGGKRLRPQLLLQVAQACGIKPAQLELALRAACAVELVHSASLVHDDLPCFDDARERRGRPTVHVLFGESMAVLVGDALLAQGIEILSAAPRAQAARALLLIRLLVRATSSTSGLIGGQSLEQQGVGGCAGSPGAPDLIERYHIMKTAVLFEMAAESAAVAAGSSKVAAWAAFGQLFGRFYQIAHDLIAARGRAAAVQRTVAGEDAAWAQLGTMLAELQKRGAQIAAAPEPMMAFLSDLCEQLLRATGLPAPPAAMSAAAERVRLV